MSGTFEIIPQPIRHTPDGQLRSCLVRHIGEGTRCTDKELWILYPPDIPMTCDEDADAYLIATLLPAMKAGADVRIYGSVSHELLANLTELQMAWRKWCPSLYHVVQMQVQCVREVETRMAGAVVAFSGGADAQFTVYRHAKGQAGFLTQSLHAGVFVHGFDIPLSDTYGFIGAARMAAEVLNDIDLRLIPVKTNMRDLWEINWEHYCAAAISSVLTGLKNYAGTGLIGSGEPYDSLVTPWGSNPITDPLLSSGEFRIHHDGAGFSRSEKIKMLAKWPTGTQHLRVCWAGELNDRNCGCCEKCVRTRLNFLLAGVQNPDCFDGPVEAGCFNSIVLRSEAAKAEWRLIKEEMLKTGIGKEWLGQVKKVLDRKASPRFGTLLPPGSHRRTWAKKIRQLWK